MHAADRHIRRVRHLRLAARSEADVRHLLPRLEDAMRCASLPDAGEQLLLIRKLALGTLPRDASPQTLALIVERRVAAVGGVWADGGGPEAETADFIRFASRLDARIELALRLACGRPAAAWYWQAAVPEYRPAASPADNLRRIALALAELPEARAALPAWVARLVDAGGHEALQAAVPPGLGTHLVRRLGLPDLPIPPAAMTTPPPAATRALAPSAWLVRMLRACRPAPPQDPWTRPTPATGIARAYRASIATPDAPDIATTQHPPTPGSDQPGPEVPPSQSPASIPRPPFGDRSRGIRSESPDSAAISPRLRDIRPQAKTDALAETGLGATLQRREPLRPNIADTDSQPWLLPTAAGGLLFLLPLMARLGVADWRRPPGLDDFPHRILALAARRLRLAVDDPIWAVLQTTPGNPRRKPALPPAAWSHPLFAPPRARRDKGDLTSCLAAARRLDDQAAVFLTAGRRWLRRAARLGLADLVLRSARIGVSATHADVHFRLNDGDIRIRRAGLDIDPGWLPWFGRVVSFHYDAGET